MSAAAHRRAASKQEQLAAFHQARYDPDARVLTTPGVTSDTFSVPMSVNPTREHLDEAERHRAHAQAHRDAARALIASEAEACSAVPLEERAACPLVDTVVDVNPVDGGVRLRLAESANTSGVLRRVRCHLAHAATRGFEGMASCPLYLRGLSAEMRSDLHCIDVLVDDPELQRKLEGRSEALLPAVHDEMHRQVR